MKYEIERSEDIPCSRKDCLYWDNTYEQCCGAEDNSGDPSVATCNTYRPDYSMITIDNIECLIGSAAVHRHRFSYFSEWRGKASFLKPQKTVNMGSAIKYCGPLFGLSAEPINISGTIYLTKAIRNNDQLIEGVEFVGSGVPVNEQGQQLKPLVIETIGLETIDDSLI